MFSIILASSVFALSTLSILLVIFVSIADRYFFKKNDIRASEFCFWKVSLLLAMWAASGVYLFG
jgi:hypothetical protein